MLLITAVTVTGAAADPRWPVDRFLVVGDGTRVVGHRGAAARAPENTVAGFRLAFETGVPMVELDVALTADGVPVCLHDRTVRRTTDGRGAVARMDADDVRRLDAGSWFGPEFRGEPVPTLAEALAAGDGLFNLEIKPVAGSEEVPRVLAAVLAVVRRAEAADRVLLSSFDRRVVAAAVATQPDVRVALVIERRRDPETVVDEAVALGVDAVHVHRTRISPELVAACHRVGLPVGAYTVDRPDEARRFARLGVDYLFADDPASVAAALSGPAGE